MKIPFVTKYIERQEETIRAEATERARLQLASEMAEAMMRASATNSPYQLVASVQPGYPNGCSPHPLYGMDRPNWYSTPSNPRRKPDAVVDIDTLRRFADTWDPLRSIISHLKREIHAQPFGIGPKDKDDDSDETKVRVQEALHFFSRSGGLGELNEHRMHFEAKTLDDVLVVGAMAVWKNFSKGGRLLQALPIDAATIRPRMDAYGWPGPGEDWYEQWIMGSLIVGFRPEEMIYDGLWPVTHSPYFRSPVEYLIATCLSGVKADEWNRTWLTDGNEPGRMIQMPEGWTPDQQKEFWDFFQTVLMSDPKRRNGMVPVPNGVAPVEGHSRKDQDFSEFEMNLIRRACAIFGVQPASIGFAGEQYKVSQEGAHQQTTQFGAGQLLELLHGHYNGLLEDLGFSDLCIVDSITAEETPLERAQRLSLESGGVNSRTVNEIRQDRGDDPIDGGDVILVPNNLVTLADAQTVKVPDETTEPAQPADEPAPTDEEPTDQESKDLERWERKALRRAKEGRSPSCEFASEFIRPSVARRITGDLKKARGASDVKRAFSRATELDEEDLGEPAKQDRSKLAAALLMVLKGTASGITELATAATAKSQFVDAALDLLKRQHTDAAKLGRLRATGFAGDPATVEATAADLALGLQAAESQVPFLQGFADDLLSGTLSDEQIARRAAMYAQRLVGTANQSWLMSMPVSEEITWIDTGDQSECADCQERAENSPYGPQDLPGVPGDCSTECLTECRCYLVTAQGETSFYDPRETALEP